MIRRPLRPLARILQARDQGVDPDRIEAQERAARMAACQKAERRKAERRLVLLGGAFVLGFGLVAAQMARVSASEPEPVRSASSANPIVSDRADIVDRNGRVLATNVATTSLYAHPRSMVDPRSAADNLARIFPDLDVEELYEDFTGNLKFLWVERSISPEQHQLVHDLGEPGLLFGRRESRLYPNGSILAHTLGGARFGREGVHSAEVMGRAGIELGLNSRLTDPETVDEPVVLSIDLPAQTAMEEVLAEGMEAMNAKGAVGILMEADTGQIRAMASLPDFDPNNRPTGHFEGDPSDNPLFNRALQGRYELGSTFKPFTVALALETGLVAPQTMVDSKSPMKWGRYRIRDYKDYGPQLTVEDIIVKSSNVGTARIAIEQGGAAQRRFLEDLGLMTPLRVELAEAPSSAPILPRTWSELTTMTVSYGHGISVTPLHLAAAYATIANGGYRVEPSFIENPNIDKTDNPQVISERTSRQVRDIMRQVMVRGTAREADVEGYALAGKTGTADKPLPGGGYARDKVISTLASVFPASAPKYVLIVALDEPTTIINKTAFRTAGLTAAPVAADIVRRLTPILGMRPGDFGTEGPEVLYTLAGNNQPLTQKGSEGIMTGSERADTLMGFEELGLLAGTRRGGDWSGTLPSISGISVDSRRTEKGHLFAAMPGSNVHGAEFISYALRMGAAVVLTDAEGLEIAEKELGPLPVPAVVSSEPRRTLAIAAARWFGKQPETIVAVTGTNGKTSVASFTRQIWETTGHRAVNFGTVGVEGAVSAPLSHTTPEPVILHELLSDLAKSGVTHAAMEASSHGLDQRRLDGVRLSAAGYTNISRDHLDYHAGFGEYFDAKMGLFDRVLPRGGTAVINMDDRHGESVLAIVRERGQNVITIGRGDEVDLRLLGQRFDATGQELLFQWHGRSHGTRLNLIGGFQGHNALVAAGLAIGSGGKPDDVFEALRELRTVRGRMERAATRQNGSAVFVDYAHTPEALHTALDALRPHVMGRLVVVFGAGGDRDRGKRLLMGQAAAENADVVYVTDDNPRSEDPAAIRAEIMPGCPEATEIGDRAEAILAAVDTLQPGDALLIAGKGHETGQIVGDDVLPFNDLEQASVAVSALDGLGS